MRKRGKQFAAARGQVAPDRTYSIEEAIPLVQKVKFAKFDETVDMSLRLGVDPKHADQMVRGTVVLPHGLGKSKRVLAIAGGEKQKEAQEAGADIIGGEEMVDKIQGGEARPLQRALGERVLHDLVARLRAANLPTQIGNLRNSQPFVVDENRGFRSLERLLELMQLLLFVRSGHSHFLISNP